MNNLHLPYSAWLFRLAVDRSFRKKGVARSLVAVVQNYCRKNGYMDVQVAVSECQEDARRIFTDCGLVNLVGLLCSFFNNSKQFSVAFDVPQAADRNSADAFNVPSRV